MQPALIRLVDNIRKQLERSSLRGDYREVQAPIPGHALYLQGQNQDLEVSLWELCYEVCFQDYDRIHSSDRSVTIDPNLLAEDGEVDWAELDQKAQRVVQQIFSSLT